MAQQMMSSPSMQQVPQQMTPRMPQVPQQMPQVPQQMPQVPQQMMGSPSMQQVPPTTQRPHMMTQGQQPSMTPNNMQKKKCPSRAIPAFWLAATIGAIVVVLININKMFQGFGTALNGLENRDTESAEEGLSTTISSFKVLAFAWTLASLAPFFGLLTCVIHPLQKTFSLILIVIMALVGVGLAAM